MKLKFVASAAGILFSIMFSAIFRRGIGMIHYLCGEFQAALATRYPVLDPIVDAVQRVGNGVGRMETGFGDARAIAVRTATASERSLQIWGDVVEQLHSAATQLKQFNGGG